MGTRYPRSKCPHGDCSGQLLWGTRCYFMYRSTGKYTCSAYFSPLTESNFSFTWEWPDFNLLGWMFFWFFVPPVFTVFSFFVFPLFSLSLIRAHFYISYPIIIKLFQYVISLRFRFSACDYCHTANLKDNNPLLKYYFFQLPLMYFNSVWSFCFISNFKGDKVKVEGFKPPVIFITYF